MKTATSDTEIDMIVKPISCAPCSAASSGAIPILDVAVDVLEHHDRIVDDEADGDGQRHQREIVQAVACQVHRAGGAEDGERHGDRRE